MLRRHNTKSEKKVSVFSRLARSVVSMVFIATFVLSVTYGIRFLSQSSPAGQLATLTNSLPQNSKFGEVAGILTQRLEENKLNELESDYSNQPPFKDQQTPTADVTPVDTTKSDTLSTSPPPSDNVKNNEMVLAVFADSHNDSHNMSLAIQRARDAQVEVIVHLGDHTNLGLVEDLQNAFTSLSSSGMTYYAVPGDRDLWKTSGPQNFKDIFGSNRHAFILDDSKFVVFDNSMNFSNIPQDDLDWFLKEVETADFVFLSQPLYHPSNKVMGNFEGEEIVNVKKQAQQMLDAIRNSNVKAVFAGEHHMSSETPDPQDPKLMHYVSGAVTRTINDRPQSILQTPRFSLLKLKADGVYEVSEIIL
jgi:predicted phosphodiesterase